MIYINWSDLPRNRKKKKGTTCKSRFRAQNGEERPLFEDMDGLFTTVNLPWGACELRTTFSNYFASEKSHILRSEIVTW